MYCIKLSQGISIDLSIDSYICAIVENLGDYINHLGYTKEDISGDNLIRKLIQYSKYLYRIYHCISKAYGKINSENEQTKYDELAEFFKGTIIPREKIFQKI